MATLLLLLVFISMAMVPNVSSFTGGRVGHNRGVEQLCRSTKESNTLNVISTDDRVSVTKPEIHWTVPGYKVGWQDDNGKWFDEDGPRNGPPLNYWRQSADEREYNEAMDVVDAILVEHDIESKVKNLEKRCSVRKPSLSRMILGRWAPLLLSSRRIAYNAKPSYDYDQIEIPFMVDICRSSGRKFGPKNHYGIFDLKLENGEELVISATGDDDDSISATIPADQANEPLNLGMVGEVQLQFGGITFVSDYVMIQRSPEGAIDFFLRNDKSYLGATAEDKKKHNLE